ncbi:MAG: heavy metal translocating P-type ATPase [Candidatus Eisenbacteria bacterium]|nr:heavy metal translocating P-type ATPase [Candidatus Eisenbacteria bacterium]
MKRANLPSEGEPESGSGLLAGDEGPPRAAHGSIEEEKEARVRLSVRGMTCAACALAVEKALRSVPGVRSAVVNAAAGAAAVRFDAARANLPALLDAVRRSGYRASPSAGEDEPALQKERLGLLWTALLAVPILLIHEGIAGVPSPGVLLLVLATLLQFTAGLRFYRGAYYSLRSGNAGMDVLVSLGISAAWGYSLLVVIFPSYFPGERAFFDTSALLILFVRFGKMLEARARGKAGDAMRALLRAAPESALLVADGQERNVPVESLQVGSIFRVRAGDRVPVDGSVVDGEAAVDEAAVTGESVPVRRSAGDRVVGGTMLANGALLVRAEAVGEETFLGRMVRMVEEAQLDRAPIQRFADRVSNRFVPAVVAIALAAFFVWLLVLRMPFSFALARAVAVVVVACPCALGLATPTAILVGSGIGLRRGILFKRASALEEIAGVRAVLFDKTGTITRGEPAVTDIRASSNTSENEVLSLAASGASLSGHPLSRAVVRAARERGASFDKPDRIEEHAGRGIHFSIKEASHLLGNEELLESRSIERSNLRAEADRLADEGKTVLWLARGDRLAGILALRDEAKPGVTDVIARIRSLGISTALVTGDRRRTAEGIAAHIGIGDVYAEVLPDRKAEIVRAAKKGGRAVAMVGDGINDAPALAAADVGIAIGAGTDVAKETGDVVLVHGDPADVAVAVELGRATLRKVKQNLFFAFFYNALAIPFAAGAFARWGVLLPPEIAGLAMALSSVSVVLNSVDLRRWRPVGD